MNDLIPICHYEGKITKGDIEITAKDADLVEIRKEHWDGLPTTQSLSEIHLR